MNTHETDTTSELHRIEELISGGLLDEADSALRCLRATLIQGMNLQEKAKLYLLSTTLCIARGEYKRALVKAKTVLRMAGRTDDHSLYAEAKHDLGRILFRLGRSAEAEQELIESYAFYRRVRDFRKMTYPLTSLAQVHFYYGNINRAVEILEQAVAHELKHGFLDLVEIDERNLIRVALIAGDFARISTLLDRKGPESSCLSTEEATYQRIALKGIVCTYLLLIDNAEQYLETALVHHAGVGSSRDATVCREFLGLLEYNRGNYRQARKYYQQVLDTPEPTASAVAQTLRMLTDVEIAEGKWDAATETAKKAEAAITKINERIELGALWRAYGQIHAHRGEHDTARDYFTKSIDLLREIGARYELALSYLICGRSESYSREERKFNLEMSRMLFLEMQVSKRVEQVEQCLLKLTDLQAHAQFVGKRPAIHGCPAIITKNPEMLQILSAIDRIKDTNMTILITGETGTGKDFCAEYIHKTSVRSGGPFRVVNSAAIPEALLESELFGFRKGTYTGATQDKKGMIESADGGTFYFDEIGEASPSVQTKILRVIDTRRLRRLGDTSDVEINVRFIAATNYDLAARVENSLFRKDLYYRLRQMPICLPALRERKDDIELLVRHFLSEAGVADPGSDSPKLQMLIQSFRSQEWPGNVRELKYVVNRLVALATKSDIGEIVNLYKREKSRIQVLGDDLCQRERLLMALRKNGDNRSKAARELGLPESTLRYQLKKFGITPDSTD
jgi:two-component system response regulator HydG